MSIRVVNLPAREDIESFRNGTVPLNHFMHDFSTPAEAGSYKDGVGSMNDLGYHEIISSNGLALEVDFDGDVVTIAFGTREEKDAYLMGIEDGDGFIEPMVIREDEDPELFTKMLALVNRSSPSP